MKSEVKYTYEKEDILQIVLLAHEKMYPAPPGMKWEIKDGKMNYRDEIEIEAVSIETSKPESEVTE